MEQLKNLGSTTLASGYTSGAGSISVTAATSFPSAGTFCVTILDATTGAVKLIFRVTSVSGTTFTGGAEGADANASSGDVVVGTMLTAAALSQISADMEGYGTISQRPASPALVGARFVASDSVFDYARWNGSTWDQFIAGMKCAPPNAGSPPTFPTFATGTNGTEDSIASANDALIWQTHGSSGNNLSVRTQTIPSAPYRKRLRLRFNQRGDSFEAIGLVLYDGTKAKLFGLGTRNDAKIYIVTYEWSDLNSPSLDVQKGPVWPTMRGGLLEIQVDDDGVNRHFWLIQDGIQANANLYETEGNTHFLTPTQIGVGMLSYGGPDTATIVDWSDV